MIPNINFFFFFAVFLIEGCNFITERYWSVIVMVMALTGSH